MTTALQPHRGPWVWRGTDLAQTEDWIDPLDAAAIAEIQAAVAAARAAGRPLERLTRADFPLPTLAPRLAAWMRELDTGRGFVLVRGLPVERWGDEAAQLAWFGLGLHLGTPASQNAAGDLLGHVRDTGADPADPSVRLYKTRDKLRFHTDGADVIGLLCLRTARSGGESRLRTPGSATARPSCSRASPGRKG
ncbi:MAG: TauD/TfdA family dioxygenase [Proteobacteria bacterium]|nr:TauD/TfdA family dioxygenase [Pseudomonadota bacterium]